MRRAVFAWGLFALVAAGAWGADPWTKEGLIAYAQQHASTLTAAQTSLQNARDNFAFSGSFWQSSVGAGAQASDRSPLAASVTGTLKPLDQVSLDVSYDAAQGLKAGANLRPFANSTAWLAAKQSLETEELRYKNTTQTLTKTVATAYAQWVRAKLSLDIAQKDRVLKQDSLDAEQIRYDAGKSSETTIGDARVALLDSDKALWSQKTAEKSARDTLFLTVGYDNVADFDQQALADPVLESPDALLARAKSILASGSPARESFDLALARLRAQQAEESARIWPTLLGGLSANASYSLQSSSWSATVGYNLSFSTLVDPQEKALSQASNDAETALRVQQIQARSAAQAALWNLQGAVSQLQLSLGQLAPAQAALDAQNIRSTAGSSTTQKLQDLEINLLRAQSAVIAAQADLEQQLLAWEE